MKNLEAVNQVKNISTNKKGLSAKYIYGLITSRGLSIFITCHLHRTITQYTSNRAPIIFSFFVVDNIYYFVIKRLSARVVFRPTLS